MQSLRSARPDLALLGTLVLHTIVRAFYADVVPMYDSRYYVDECVAQYLQAPLDILRLNCFGHPSMGFMAVVALFMAIDPGSTLLLHASTTLLGLASIVAFHALCGRVFTAPSLLWDRRLLVACYGLGAPVLSVAMNVNPDYGVLVFLVLLLECLLAGRYGRSALFGAGLVLSKEAGLLLYCSAVGAFVLHAWIRPRTMPPSVERYRAVALLATPLVVFVAVKLVERLTDRPLLWTGDDSLLSLLSTFTTFELLDPTFLTYSFDILALGFTWLLGVPLVVFVLSACVREVVGRPRDRPEGFDARNVRILLTVFALAFLLLTRFKTFNNVRYFGALYPLVIASAGYALCWLGAGAGLRRGLLAAAVALSFSFNFHSRDPVSIAFFGSFSFGKHDLLHVAWNDPCCGYGRDQLVYNAQFTSLHYLQNEIYRELRPQPSDVLVTADHVDFAFSGRVDSETFERTLRHEGSHPIKLHDVSAIAQLPQPPARLHFLAFPNFDNRHAYSLLGTRYRELSRRTVSHRGYEMLVHSLELAR